MAGFVLIFAGPVPDPGVFLDPTLQQIPEMRGTEMAEVPVIGQLPAGVRFEDLAGTLTTARRDDVDITYAPMPGPADIGALLRTSTDKTGALLRAEGEFIASQAFAMLRNPPLLEQVRQAPYPRLQRQLTAIGDAENVIGGGEWNFRDRLTGAEIRLASIM